MSFLLVKIAAKPIAILLAMLVVATLKPFLRAIVFLVPLHARTSYLEHAAGFSGETKVGFGSIFALALAVALYFFVEVMLQPVAGNGAFVVAFFPAILFFYLYFFFITLWRAAKSNRFAASAVGSASSFAARAIDGAEPGAPSDPNPVDDR